MVKVASSVWNRLGELAGLVATPLLPAHYVALFAPLAAGQAGGAVAARVEAVKAECAGVTTLTLRPGRGWRDHLAGQHVRVGVVIDGRIATRTYSISSPPRRRARRDDRHIAITVKSQGHVSRALADDVEVGAFVTLGMPAGDFVWPAVAPARALFITAGSGVTPIASMLRSLAVRGALPDIVHVHHARTPEDVIFGAELRALAAVGRGEGLPGYRLIEVHTARDPRRFDGERLASLVPDWTEREAWACGPAGLLEAVAAAFAAHGRSHALHVERFRAALAPLPPNVTGGEVRFGAGAVPVCADGRTPLLHVAESAGLAPRHGCRMGICHSCDTTLVSGCVRDLRTGTPIAEPGAQIQLCVCAAAGDVELALPGETA